MYTKDIAKSLIRDKEFIKRLILELKTDKLVTLVDRSKKGDKYKRWKRWALSSKAFEAYKNLV